jgi:apolipoprotein N-acyltransferase
MRRLLRALATLIPHRTDWRAMGWGGVGCALLSAAMMTLAFPRWGVDWLAWIGLAPIFAATRSRPPRAAKWLWYLFGVAWIYASVCWFNVTVYVNVLVIGGIILMALILALWVLLFGWCALWLRRLGPLSLALIPMAWVAIEWLHHFGDLAFPWLFLAHTQWARPTLIQSASLFGTHGLSFLIVAGNLILVEVIALAIRVRRGEREFSWVGIAALAWGALMVLNTLLGAHALARWHRPPGEEALRVAIVQPAWEQRDKLEAMMGGALGLDLYRVMLEQLRAMEPGSVDLVILPESVIMDFAFPLEGRHWRDALAHEAERLDATLIFGANRAAPREGLSLDTVVSYSDLEIANSIWVLDPEGNVAGVYDKIRLVPFSESAPLISLIPGLMELTLGNIALFVPGEEHTLLPVRWDSGTALIGAQVCFESTFADLVRRFTREGAQVLVTVTNDAWFLETSGPRQHWIVQPFRAVENRRWTIQAANTGISSVVDPAGIVIERTDLGECTVMHQRVEPLDGQTLYTRHGDWLAQCFLALSALATVFAIARHRRRQRTERPQ